MLHAPVPEGKYTVISAVFFIIIFFFFREFLPLWALTENSSLYQLIYPEECAATQHFCACSTMFSVLSEIIVLAMSCLWSVNALSVVETEYKIWSFGKS